MEFTRRLIGILLTLLMVLVAAPPPARAADELPLVGAVDLTPGRDSLGVALTYAAPAGGTISEFRLELAGPSFDGVVLEIADAGAEISWIGEQAGLAAGTYTLTARAEVRSGGRLITGSATWTAAVGIGDPVPGSRRLPELQPVPPRTSGSTIDPSTDAGHLPASTTDDPAIAEVVVYGGTPSGVMAAVSAARTGAKVILLEPTGRIGGMISNGLTATDYGHPATIGGVTDEFFDRTQAIEGSAYGRWRFPPSTAEFVFLSMLAQAGVTVILDEALAEGGGVTTSGTRITQIRTTTGRTVIGQTFVDASYEGDLMAGAGVSYRIGRESSAEYAETRGGVRPRTTIFTPPASIDPAVPLAAPGPIGSGDNRIQNSNYRLCFSIVPGNRIPFTAPPGYDPATYDLPAAFIASRVASGLTPDITWFLWPVALTNGKYDVNNNGQVSIGVHGLTWPWPDGSYATRDAIAEDLTSYTRGFLHFLTFDPRVPQRIRSQMAGYGLCADEFVDSGNWPELLYLREGRRMVGVYVLRERDVEVERTKTDTIAIASYAFDSHHLSRWIDGSGRLSVEGGFWAGREAATRWSIPYRSLTPRRDEVSNLLVSVAVSVTHVANAALRLEPQYMMMGEAAGTAAALAARGIGGQPPNIAVQDVSVTALRTLLRGRGSVIDNYLFWDSVTSPFRGDIERTHLAGITFGCTPVNFCPTAPVTREVMAAWLVNALKLPPASRDYFTDDEASPHEDSINRLRQAGITAGCGGTRFCPTGTVTREQMAAFLVRAYRLPLAARDYFTDDETSMFEGDINRLAASGITAGCGGTRFCPSVVVPREQMAAFLDRARR